MTWYQFMKTLAEKTGEGKNIKKVKAIERLTFLSRTTIYAFIKGRRQPKSEHVIISLLHAGVSLGLSSKMIDWGLEQISDKQSRQIARERVYGKD